MQPHSTARKGASAALSRNVRRRCPGSDRRCQAPNSAALKDHLPYACPLPNGDTSWADSHQLATANNSSVHYSSEFRHSFIRGNLRPFRQLTLMDLLFPRLAPERISGDL